MKIGVVADDITGSNDIGICFVNGGASVVIYSFHENLKIEETDADVVIIDTDSRFDSRKDSYNKVYRATKQLQEWGANKFYNKTCSVFRGNIGTEFDAMQDALDINRSVVVLGFPKNGRTTISGIHYVYGIELKNTQFANDPIHPMMISSLKDILSAQTLRNVLIVSCNEYNDIGKLYDKIKKFAGYLIFDVRDDIDLAFLAELFKEEKNICGSSAIAEYIPKTLHMNCSDKKTNFSAEKEKGILVLAGSLTPQTAKQIEFASKNMKSVKINTETLMETDSIEYKKETINAAVQEINENRNILIYTANSFEEVRRTKESAKKMGMDDKTAGKYISDFISEIADAVCKECGMKKFISLGGDTSAAIVRKLGIQKMYVLEEIEAGVPTLTSGENGQFFFTLKSGSFGSDNFILKAINQLEAIN